jgi:uncharacterized protein YecE (DUF72 family)
MPSAMGKIFVGTSGWNYKHWMNGVFYPPGMPAAKWLEHYVQYFNSVELNVTFYRLVRKETFQNWHKKTPKNFYFVAKGSRFITHIKRLKSVAEPLDVFMKNVVGLKEKLVTILWQFAPKFKKDLGRLEVFLKLLDKRTDVPQAFEFRHPSWFDEEVYDLLKKYNACLCVAHSDRHPCVKVLTADFLYLRFHGEALYRSNYTDEQLQEWADYAKPYRKRDILAFFNNDAEGFAVKNAMKFQEMLSEPASAKPAPQKASHRFAKLAMTHK